MRTYIVLTNWHIALIVISVIAVLLIIAIPKVKKVAREYKSSEASRSYAAAYNLNDTQEQKRIVAEHNLIVEKRSELSRRNRELIEDKISFMIQNKIIKINL